MINKNKELIKLTACIFGFFLTINLGFAQAEMVQAIEQSYQRVKNGIQKQQYHQNEYKINSQRFSLHQPGYRQYYESYYYTFDKRPEMNQKPLIKAVFIQSIKEETKYLKEYIYDNEGNFIYYSQKVLEDARVLDEVRLYIHQQKLIKWLREDGSTSLQIPLAPILEKAAKYKEKFAWQLSQVNLR